MAAAVDVLFVSSPIVRRRDGPIVRRERVGRHTRFGGGVWCVGEAVSHCGRCTSSRVSVPVLQRRVLLA